MKVKKINKKKLNVKKASIIDVIEVVIIKNDYPVLMPNRIVKEYWTLEGMFIGSIDPLNRFSAIINAVENGYHHISPTKK